MAYYLIDSSTTLMSSAPSPLIISLMSSALSPQSKPRPTCFCFFFFLFQWTLPAKNIVTYDHKNEHHDAEMVILKKFTYFLVIFI